MQDRMTSHFWVGQFPEPIADEYFAETYSDSDDTTPVSAFARDQGVWWYDHDFLEYTRGDAPSIQELAAGCSYSEQWADELARRVTAAGITGINLCVFIHADEIEQPRSVEGDGYWLRYLGVIEYRI